MRLVIQILIWLLAGMVYLGLAEFSTGELEEDDKEEVEESA